MQEMSELTPDEQFEQDTKLMDASMALATFAASRLDARRGYEWKISFGVWALLAAALLRGFTALPLTAGILLLLAYGWWLQNIWLRHTSDADFMWNYVNESQRLVSKYDVKVIPPDSSLRIGRGVGPVCSRKWYGFLGDWSLVFQFFVTLGLAAGVYVTADKVTIFQMMLRPETR